MGLLRKRYELGNNIANTYLYAFNDTALSVLAKTQGGRDYLNSKINSGTLFPAELAGDFQSDGTEADAARLDQPPGKLVIVVNSLKGLSKPMGFWNTLDPYVQISIGEYTNVRPASPNPTGCSAMRQGCPR